MADPGGMRCQELTELVTDYFERALSPVERARFEEHLGACGGCRAYLDQMRRTIQLVGTLTDDDIPADASERLLRAYRAWKRSL